MAKSSPPPPRRANERACKRFASKQPRTSRARERRTPNTERCDRRRAPIAGVPASDRRSPHIAAGVPRCIRPFPSGPEAWASLSWRPMPNRPGSRGADPDRRQRWAGVAAGTAHACAPAPTVAIHAPRARFIGAPKPTALSRGAAFAHHPTIARHQLPVPPPSGSLIARDD